MRLCYAIMLCDYAMRLCYTINLKIEINNNQLHLNISHIFSIFYIQ